MAAGGEAARVLPGLQGLDDWAGRHSHTPERAPQGPGWLWTHTCPGTGASDVRSRTRIRPRCPHCTIHLHEVQTQVKVLCCHRS